MAKAIQVDESARAGYPDDSAGAPERINRSGDPNRHRNPTQRKDQFFGISSLDEDSFFVEKNNARYKRTKVNKK